VITNQGPGRRHGLVIANSPSVHHPLRPVGESSTGLDAVRVLQLAAEKCARYPAAIFRVTAATLTAPASGEASTDEAIKTQACAHRRDRCYGALRVTSGEAHRASAPAARELSAELASNRHNLPSACGVLFDGSGVYRPNAGDGLPLPGRVSTGSTSAAPRHVR
jgi:hypothetical protein